MSTSLPQRTYSYFTPRADPEPELSTPNPLLLSAELAAILFSELNNPGRNSVIDSKLYAPCRARTPYLACVLPKHHDMPMLLTESRSCYSNVMSRPARIPPSRLCLGLISRSSSRCRVRRVRSVVLAGVAAALARTMPIIVFHVVAMRMPGPPGAQRNKQALLVVEDVVEREPNCTRGTSSRPSVF